MLSYSTAEISFHASLTLFGAVSEEYSDLQNGGWTNWHHNCGSSPLRANSTCTRPSSCVISGSHSSLFLRRIKGDFDKRVGSYKFNYQLIEPAIKLTTWDD